MLRVAISHSEPSFRCMHLSFAFNVLSLALFECLCVCVCLYLSLPSFPTLSLFLSCSCSHMAKCALSFFSKMLSQDVPRIRTCWLRIRFNMSSHDDDRYWTANAKNMLIVAIMKFHLHFSCQRNVEEKDCNTNRHHFIRIFCKKILFHTSLKWFLFFDICNDIAASADIPISIRVAKF